MDTKQFLDEVFVMSRIIMVNKGVYQPKAEADNPY